MATITTLKAGNWSDPTVWNGGVLPGVNDAAYSAFAIVIDQDITVLELRCTASSAITAFTASGSTTRNITLTGSGLVGTGYSHTVLNITNSGVTNVTTAIGVATSNYIQLNVAGATGGTVNLTITNTPTYSAVTGYSFYITSVNYTVNVTSNDIVANTNVGRFCFIAGTSNTVNWVGNISGASVAASGAIIFSSATSTLNYTGNITGNLSPGINADAAGGNINVTGTFTNGAVAAITSSSTAVVKVSGIVNSYSNINPILAKKVTIDSALNTTWTYNTDTVGVNKTLYTSGTAQGQPAINNVRSGTVYGTNSEYTGTLIMALPANVRKGVPTDATIGTGDLTAQEFWNKLTSELTTSDSVGKLLTDNVNAQISSRATNSGVISELNISSTDVAVRMRNVSTVGITGQQLAGQG